jgi:hypothetical protein
VFQSVPSEEVNGSGKLECDWNGNKVLATVSKWVWIQSETFWEIEGQEQKVTSNCRNQRNRWIVIDMGKWFWRKSLLLWRERDSDGQWRSPVIYREQLREAVVVLLDCNTRGHFGVMEKRKSGFLKTI